MSSLIAIVDDERDIVELVSLHLTKAGFKVSEFTDADGFMAFLRTTTPDLVVLDLMLPDADGMEICRHLKNNGKYAHMPIIMLTARTEETDRVVGLELGADDYVTKPFSPRELVARIKAVLRRGQMRPEAKRVTIGDDLTIDANKFEVRVKDKKVELTPTEFRILKLMSERVGWVYSRDKLMELAWEEPDVSMDRTVDTHIKTVRAKLRAVKPDIDPIQTHRGIGYSLKEAW